MEESNKFFDLSETFLFPYMSYNFDEFDLNENKDDNLRNYTKANQ